MIGPVSAALNRLGDIGAGLAALVKAGAIRPLKPATIAELGRRVRAEGVRSHLVLLIHASEQGGRPAILYEDRSISWTELKSRTNRLVNHLSGLGVGAGDAVGIMLPNRPEFVESHAAVLRMGGIAGFISPKAPPADAQSLLERMGAKALVTHRPDVAPAGLPIVEAGEPYEKALELAPDREPPVADKEGKVVIFTSGTTGRPKGAVRNLERSGVIGTLAGFLRVVPFRRDDVHMAVCPLYHSSGSGFATVAQVLGNTIVLVESFSPQTFCETVQRHRVTTTAVVPTMLRRLADWPDARNYDLSSLRVVVCTGSALREEVRAAAREVVGDVIYDLYGSTEMGWVSVATPEDQRRAPGTVGRPVPGVTVRILDEDGSQRAPGEVGEVWAHSDLLMESYLNDPDLTTDRMRHGYVSVRDLGYVDRAGYLHVVDRADDMVISGGVNVYPAEAEIALGSHPKVREAAAFGIPDPDWGHRLVAAVVAGDSTPEELVAWCKDRVGYAAVPKEIRIKEALPRNDIGKIDKRKLAEEWTT